MFNDFWFGFEALTAETIKAPACWKAYFCQTTRHHVLEDTTLQFIVYLTLQMPRVEILDLYKN
jgi:hypothetical protein